MEVLWMKEAMINTLSKQIPSSGRGCNNDIANHADVKENGKTKGWLLVINLLQDTYNRI